MNFDLSLKYIAIRIQWRIQKNIVDYAKLIISNGAVHFFGILFFHFHEISAKLKVKNWKD